LFAVILAPGLARAQSSGNSLARYVPRENPVIYIEFDGLDAHAAAWTKTAAHKILNDTTTGVMLEELFVQAWGRIPNAKVSGKDALALVKHIAKSGFLFALGGDTRKPNPDYGVFAFRGVFNNKEIRGNFVSALQALNAPNTKPQAVIRAGHKVVSGKSNDKTTYTWWVEETKKEDLVVVFPTPEAADLVLETLDGKKPNLVDEPIRANLMKAENGFEPIAAVFISPVVFKDPKMPSHLGLSQVTRLDYAWGFEGDALMSILRLDSPSPRKGALGLIDGVSFDREKLPPLPDTVKSFGVASLNLVAEFDKLMELQKTINPATMDQVKAMLDTIKAKTKLRLREDILAHLGPRLAWYSVPAKASTSPAAPSILGAMMAASGVDQLPRGAIVIDVDDPVAFGKSLDELMNYVNREIKSALAGPAAPGATPGKTSKNRAPSGPSFEFRLASSDVKTYILQVPTELATMIPSTLRPTIRVGPKQVVIATSPDLARGALEVKTPWTAPGDLASAYNALPSKLRVLSMDDPRDTTPATLAALPGKLQVAINAVLGQGAGAAPPPPSAPPAAPAPGGRRPPVGAPMGDSPRPGTPPAGASGGPAPGTAGGASGFTLQVDSSKLPSAEAIKALLFPSLVAVEVNDEGLKIISREAFPKITDPTATAGQLSRMLPAMGLAPKPPAGMTMPPMAGPGGIPGGFNPGPAAAPAVGGNPGGGRPGRPGLRGGSGGAATSNPD
jgi:hypothetical protein